MRIKDKNNRTDKYIIEDDFVEKTEIKDNTKTEDEKKSNKSSSGVWPLPNQTEEEKK
jgi:hypothetical protein